MTEFSEFLSKRKIFFLSQIISSSKMLFICFLLYYITRTKKKLRFFRFFFGYLGWFRHIILQFLPFRSFAFFAENSIYDFAFRGSQNMRKNGMCICEPMVAHCTIILCDLPLLHFFPDFSPLYLHWWSISIKSTKRKRKSEKEEVNKR